MRQGRLESQRELVLPMYTKSMTKREMESFIKFGATSTGTKPPMRAAVYEKMAEIQRTGKVVFD